MSGTGPGTSKFDSTETWRISCRFTDGLLAVAIKLVGACGLVWLLQLGQIRREHGKIANTYNPTQLRIRWLLGLLHGQFSTGFAFLGIREPLEHGPTRWDAAASSCRLGLRMQD